LSGSTIAGAADLQYLAALLQLLNQPVAHFSSRAKKAEAFLKYRYPAVVDECPLPIGSRLLISSERLADAFVRP